MATGSQQLPSYTPEDYAQLLKMHRRGESAERIALVLHRTTSSILNHFAKQKPIWQAAGQWRNRQITDQVVASSRADDSKNCRRMGQATSASARLPHRLRRTNQERACGSSKRTGCSDRTSSPRRRRATRQSESSVKVRTLDLSEGRRLADQPADGRSDRRHLPSGPF